MARMEFASKLAVGAVALLHLYFALLEMVFWTGPLGQRTFRRTAEQQQASKSLAANQGLYNLFLVAGLLWSLTVADPLLALALKRFFLGCVIVAGVFGAATVSRRILFVQALPAVVAIILAQLAG